MIKFIVFLLSNFGGYNRNEPARPARLAKKPEKTRFEEWCEKAVIYVLIICLITFIILLVIVFAKYGGSVTGTEANRYQNLEHIVLYYGRMGI